MAQWLCRWKSTSENAVEVKHDHCRRIAAVTAVLKDLLLNSFVDHDAADMLGQVLVTARAPDTIPLPEQNSQLNLFLYQVTPNSGWRNVGYPSRDAEGHLTQAVPLALDLHYLLSAYGAKDFHAEVLLGYAMQLFHEMPVLTREVIRKALSPSLFVDSAAGPSGRIPEELKNLFLSGLADQIEQIKVTPSYLNMEEMFRVWMSFQVPYRTTLAYSVSVVLIDSKYQGSAALPVASRKISSVPNTPKSEPGPSAVIPQLSDIKVDVTTEDLAVDAPRDGIVTLSIIPPVNPKSQVEALLNQLSTPAGQQPRGYRFRCTSHLHASGPSSTLQINFHAVAAGEYLIRVRVDGVESRLQADINGTFNAPTIRVP